MEDRFVSSDKGVHSLLYFYQAAAAPKARRGIVAFMSRKRQLLVIQVVQGDILEAGHVVKVKHIVIDYSKCVSCGRCAAVCPRKLISDSNLRQDMDAVPAMPR